MLAIGRSISIGFIYALRGPIGAAELIDATCLNLCVQGIYPFRYRHIRIVAVQALKIEMTGLQAFKRDIQLLSDRFGVAIGRMGAF